MPLAETVAQSISVLVALILLGALLCVVGVVKEEHSALLARLITDLTLPAVIFTAMSTHPISTRDLLLPAAIIVSEIACGLLAWAVVSLLRLSDPRKGAVILASTFGSSAFLGYAVVKQVYKDDAAALFDAVFLSEIGVGLMIFTAGVFIAMRFGLSDATPAERRKAVLRFFYSPIFIALTAGAAVSFVPLPKGNLALASVYDALHILGKANTLLVTLTIGVMLHLRAIFAVFHIVILACALKLFALPTLAFCMANALSLPSLARQIVVLEAAMPTAAMCAVLAKRYGCDAELTSILVFATFVSSLFTMVMVTFALG